MPRFTREAVLKSLDNCAAQPHCTFMRLAHPHFFTANSRLSLFADDDDWAIVFEKSGFGNRSLYFELELNYFGSTLRNLTRQDGKVSNAKVFELSSIEDLEEIELGFEEVSPTASKVKLRGNYATLPRAVDGYRRWVPDVGKGPVRFQDLCRYLAFEYERRCRATEAELRTCLSPGLPLLMHIDAWYHRDGDKPSSCETFHQIADVLVSRDPAKWRPLLAPTNHWSHWPEAGAL